MKKYNAIIFSFLFILITSIISHFLFSHLGFNPTDDGYHLAGARRIVDGEIPHKDFITIRPALSFYLHSPSLFFGNNILLVSRFFVLLQFSFISLSWLFIVKKLFKIDFFKNTLGLIVFFTLGCTSFIFNLHNFPIMAWHSIDGILFASIGLAILVNANNKKRLEALAYLLIGLAPLFKQNFALFPIFTFIIFFRKKNLLPLMMAIPGLIYLFFLLIFGAINPALNQLLSHTQLSLQSFRNPNNKLLVFFIATISALFLNSKKKSAYFFSIIMTFSFLTILSFKMKNASAFLNKYSFYLFYFLFAHFFVNLFFFLKRKTIIFGQAAALVLALSVSISIGYSHPSLASGILVLIILSGIYSKIKHNTEIAVMVASATFVFFLISLQSFIFIRTYGIYRDKPAKFLTYDLGNVLKGASGVNTSKLSFEYMKDLQKAISQTNSEYVLLPDNSIHWMSSNQKNPLSIDWPQPTELAKKEMRDRVTQELKNHMNNGGAAIIQKYSSSTLFMGKIPLPENMYSLVIQVENAYSKVSETEFFEIYQLEQN